MRLTSMWRTCAYVTSTAESVCYDQASNFGLRTLSLISTHSGCWKERFRLITKWDKIDNQGPQWRPSATAFIWQFLSSERGWFYSRQQPQLLSCDCCSDLDLLWCNVQVRHAFMISRSRCLAELGSDFWCIQLYAVANIFTHKYVKRK